MRRKQRSVSHEAEKIKELRRRPEMAVEYLNASVELAFEDNNPELILIALSCVAKAYGMTRMARETKLKRESLHRMFSERGNPEWNSLFRVFQTLHLRPKLERVSATVSTAYPVRAAP